MHHALKNYHHKLIGIEIETDKSTGCKKNTEFRMYTRINIRLYMVVTYKF